MKKERKSWYAPTVYQNGEQFREGDAPASENSSGPASELAWSTSVYNPNIEGFYGDFTPDVMRNSSRYEIIRQKTLPRRRIDQLARAQDWRERDDLVASLLRVKTEFSVMGFNMQCARVLGKKGRGVDQDVVDEFQVKLDHFVRKANVRKVIIDLLYDWFATDNMILYWRTDDSYSVLNGEEQEPHDKPQYEDCPGLIDICALNPAEVHYDDSLGIDEMKVRIPFALRNRIENAVNRVSSVEKVERIKELLNDGVPFKFIVACMKGQDTVTLSKLDGDNWRVVSLGRKHTGLIKPSMFAIFLSLEQRRAFIEGDFSASQMMKHFIMLIQQGESITTGPLAGDTKNWLKKTDSADLLKQFNNISQTMRMVANHTMKVTFVFPPAEMFKPDKYQTCEQRIYNWAGVIVTLMQGAGDAYSSGFLGIKRLVAHLGAAREEIAWLFGEFFDDNTVAPAMEVPDNCHVTARFDENALKEPKQLLEEIKTLMGNGALDPESMLLELGRDPDLVKARKVRNIEENNTTHIWEPIFNPNAKAPDAEGADPGGRPGNPGTTASAATRTQSPTPAS